MIRAPVFIIIFLSQAVLAEDLPPTSYMGVELFKTTKETLWEEFGESSKTYFDKHPNSTGYCYKSPAGVSVAFMLSGPNTFDSIEVSTKELSYNCTKIQSPIEKCISNYCIGMSRSEIESALNNNLRKVDYPKGDDLEVAYYEYSLSMPDERAKYFPGITEIPINHNIWFRFDDELLYAVGIWKVEHLP